MDNDSKIVLIMFKTNLDVKGNILKYTIKIVSKIENSKMSHNVDTATDHIY